MRLNTTYNGYTPSLPIISWFWSALRSFSEEERARFIQFVTGTAKVPLDGFKALQGMRGPQKFNIHRSYAGSNRLPMAHTWYGLAGVRVVCVCVCLASPFSALPWFVLSLLLLL